MLIRIVQDRGTARWGIGLAAAAALASAVYLFKNKKKSQKPARSVVDLIGNTPVLEVGSLSALTGCRILLKLECQNPGGSAKDRVARAVVEDAEAKGLLRPGHPDCVFEGTSGSTGISLATVCNAKGYEAHIVIPSDTGTEKVDLLRVLGAHIHKVPPAGIADSGHYVNTAARLAAQTTGDTKAIFANQFENEANWNAHYNGTGPEIIAQVPGIDAFVNGAGTGGTIAGVGKRLKEYRPNVRIVLADPPGSGLYHKINSGVMYDLNEREGTRRRHQVDTIVEGIGLNRVTRNLSQGLEYIDEAIRVTDKDAQIMAQHLMAKDGLFVGSSTAVNCVAVYELAKQMGPGHTIVSIWCDSGIRHLTKFWGQLPPANDLYNELNKYSRVAL